MVGANVSRRARSRQPSIQCIGLCEEIGGPTFLESDQVRQLTAQRWQLLGVLIKHSTMTSLIRTVSNKRHMSN